MSTPRPKKSATKALATGAGVAIRPRPGFNFLVGKKSATLCDEDAHSFHYLADGHFRGISKPDFFERLSRRSDGRFYLADLSKNNMQLKIKQTAMKCAFCKGWGKVNAVSQKLRFVADCPKCNGRGVLIITNKP
jgi:hypothetical protein